MKLKRFFALTLFALILTTTAACAQNAPSAAPVLYASPASQTDSAAATRGTIAHLYTLPGITRLPTQVVRLETGSGRIADIYAWPGDSVYEGQIIARLETSELQERYEAAQRSLAAQRNLFQIESRSLSLEIQALEAEAQSSERLDWLRLELSHLQRRHQQNTADAEAMLNNLRADLGDRTITAPFDGTIMLTESIGTWVNTGDAVIVVARNDGLFVEFIGTDAANFFAGQPYAKLEGQTRGGTFGLQQMDIDIEEHLDYVSRNLPPPVRFEIMAAATEMPQPGDAVSIRFYTLYAENVLRIPVNALFRIGEDAEVAARIPGAVVPDTDEIIYYVYRLENGRKTLTYVVPGAASQAFAEILEGLNEGDEVFVRP